MKVLLLSRYDGLGASSRLRFFQYLPFLFEQGIMVDSHPLFSHEYLQSYYRTGHKSYTEVIQAYLKRLHTCTLLNNYDLIWLEKELFPWGPAIFEQLIHLRKVPYIVDYDDAIHHNYDQHSAWPVRLVLRNKLNELVSRASAITVGNDYLARWACGQGASHVEIVPTVVDLNRYAKRSFYGNNTEFRIGWIGSPATAKYIWLVRDTFIRLAQTTPIRLVVVGANLHEDFGVPMECHEWKEETEVSILSTLDAGIMPLPDSPWERGKCGYKLIQYMASGLPIIASPVGVNKEIVEHGVNGFLAANLDEWGDALRTLQSDPMLRESFGCAGRKKVENKYCIQETAPRVAELLINISNRQGAKWQNK